MQVINDGDQTESQVNKYAKRRAAEVEVPTAKFEDFDLILSTGTGVHKVYAAKITGSHSQYRFVREFLSQDDSVGGKSVTATVADVEAAFPATPAAAVSATPKQIVDDGAIDEMSREVPASPESHITREG